MRARGTSQALREKTDLNQICKRKYDANICFLQSKPVANMVKATFATIFTLVCKYGSRCGLYHVCYRFALEETYVCIIFALSKFDVNPFFRIRQVNNSTAFASYFTRWSNSFLVAMLFFFFFFLS